MPQSYPTFAPASTAARLFGVKTSTLGRWRKAGKIAFIKTPGGRFLYDVGVFAVAEPPPEKPVRQTKRMPPPARRPPDSVTKVLGEISVLPGGVTPSAVPATPPDARATPSTGTVAQIDPRVVEALVAMMAGGRAGTPDDVPSARIGVAELAARLDALCAASAL